MFKKFNEFKKNFSKGFTLVEILVVLVIVAILAGLAFVSYSFLFTLYNLAISGNFLYSATANLISK